MQTELTECETLNPTQPMKIQSTTPGQFIKLPCNGRSFIRIEDARSGKSRFREIYDAGDGPKINQRNWTRIPRSWNCEIIQPPTGLVY